MKQDKEKLLNLHRLPGRLTAAQAACLLGFEEHDIRKLVQSKVLKPLGSPPRNAVKMFWVADVEALLRDGRLLAKATDVVRRGRSRNGSTARRIPFSKAAALTGRGVEEV